MAGVLIMGSDPGPMEPFLLSVLVHDRPGESWGWPFGDWTQSVTPKLGLLTVTLTLLCRSCWVILIKLLSLLKPLSSSVEGLLLVPDADDDNYFIKMSRYTAENFIREIYNKDKIDLSGFTAYLIDSDNVLHEDY